MQIPQLQIQTTPARLGLQIDKSIQSIEQPKATILMEQPAAVLEMSTTRSKLSIDTTENRAEIDMKSIIRRNNENAQYSLQAVLQGVGRRAEEGQQLMRIENGGGAIAQIAKQNANPPPAPLGIRFVGDRLKVQVDIERGDLQIQVTPQKPKHDVQVNKPIHEYTPGKVTGVMEQYAAVYIDVKW